MVFLLLQPVDEKGSPDLLVGLQPVSSLIQVDYRSRTGGAPMAEPQIAVSDEAVWIDTATRVRSGVFAAQSETRHQQAGSARDVVVELLAVPWQSSARSSRRSGSLRLTASGRVVSPIVLCFLLYTPLIRPFDYG